MLEGPIAYDHIRQCFSKPSNITQAVLHMSLRILACASCNIGAELTFLWHASQSAFGRVEKLE